MVWHDRTRPDPLRRGGGGAAARSWIAYRVADERNAHTLADACTVRPVDFLRTATPGIRVVARYRVAGGFTDAVGNLRSCTQTACVIETRRGPTAVQLADVVAAKQVPEPPPRRVPTQPSTRH